MRLLNFCHSSTIADFVSFPYRPQVPEGVDLSDPAYRGKQREADVAISETKRKGVGADPQRTLQKTSYIDATGTEQLIRPIDRVRAVRKSVGRSKLMGDSQPAFDAAIDTLRANREVTNKVSRLDRYFRQESGALKPWEQEAYSRHTASKGVSGLAPITSEQAAQLQAELRQPKNQKAVQDVQGGYTAISKATDKPSQTISYPVKGMKDALSKELTRQKKWGRLNQQQQAVNRTGIPEQVPNYSTLNPTYTDIKQVASAGRSNSGKKDANPITASYTPTQPKKAVAQASNRLKNSSGLISAVIPGNHKTVFPEIGDPWAVDELVDRVKTSTQDPSTSTPKTGANTKPREPGKKSSYEMYRIRRYDKYLRAKEARRWVGKAALIAGGLGSVAGGGYLLKNAWDRHQDKKAFKEYKKAKGYDS